MQFPPNGRWNMSKMLFKILVLSGRPTVYNYLAIYPNTFVIYVVSVLMFSGSGGNRSVVLRGCRDLNLELDFGRLGSKKPGATLRLRVSL